MVIDKGNYKLYKGDCLEVMDELIALGIKFDMILCDLPYGTTACRWDSVIPFDKLWDRYKNLITDKGCIALFGSEPFSSFLRTTNIDMYKYDWIWEKGRATGCVHAKNKPMKAHENISIFSKGTTVHKSQSKRRMYYEPVMSKGTPYQQVITPPTTGKLNHKPSKSNNEFVGTLLDNKGERYPRSVIKFSMHNVGLLHPTQKPVELLEYLIKTYTAEDMLVLDNCMGSGSTGVACLNTNRRFIGIELDGNYFNIAKKRIEETEKELKNK